MNITGSINVSTTFWIMMICSWKAGVSDEMICDWNCPALSVYYGGWYQDTNRL
jgi:hypothetical protein